MPHLVLGLLIMLGGAIVMAVGLYVRSLRASALTGAGPASSAGQRRSVASAIGSAVLLLLGLAIIAIGIIVSFEPNATAPK